MSWHHLSLIPVLHLTPCLRVFTISSFRIASEALHAHTVKPTGHFYFCFLTTDITFIAPRTHPKLNKFNKNTFFWTMISWTSSRAGHFPILSPESCLFQHYHNQVGGHFHLIPPFPLPLPFSQCSRMMTSLLNVKTVFLVRPRLSSV